LDCISQRITLLLCVFAVCQFECIDRVDGPLDVNRWDGRELAADHLKFNRLSNRGISFRFCKTHGRNPARWGV